jgi:hypothetical protein
VTIALIIQYFGWSTGELLYISADTTLKRFLIKFIMCFQNGHPLTEIHLQECIEHIMTNILLK